MYISSPFHEKSHFPILPSHITLNSHSTHHKALSTKWTVEPLLIRLKIQQHSTIRTRMEQMEKILLTQMVSSRVGFKIHILLYVIK